jgi:hypothetical protein
MLRHKVTILAQTTPHYANHPGIFIHLGKKATSDSNQPLKGQRRV